MKKTKLFLSILKERDWLESMARQGYMLEDITFGINYKFKEVEPVEKVFEIERFSLSSSGDASKQELTARKTAFDIATQTGWEVITHDESMNYYFAKDRAGDETDELYEDVESRQVRADRFRRTYTLETPQMLLSLLLIVAVIYIALFFIIGNKPGELVVWMGIFIGLTVIEVGISFFQMKAGELMYKELMLSREEWEQRKKYGVKKSFKKVADLKAFLQEQDEKGLAYKGNVDGYMLFEESTIHYRYYADTLTALKKRLKKSGKSFKKETKDWENNSTLWHEQSMDEAQKLGLNVVCSVESGTIIYRRDAGLPEVIWDNDAIKTGSGDITAKLYTTFGPILIIAFIVGFVLGFMSQMG